MCWKEILSCRARAFQAVLRLGAAAVALAYVSAKTPGQATAPQASHHRLSSASLLTTIPEPCRSGRNMPKPALELLRVVAREPSAGAYNALGAIYGQSKRLNCAVAAFRAALRLDPASWEAHNNLALALVEQNDLSNAAREFRAVIGKNPKLSRHTTASGWCSKGSASSTMPRASSKLPFKSTPDFSTLLST